jgi:hypothetical protein
MVWRGIGGWVLLLAVAFHAAAAGAQTHSATAADLGPFQSAETCRDCHQKEYTQWRESWMSKAWTAANFQHDYQALVRAAENDSRLSPQQCLRCHAPLSLVLRDPGVEKPASQEGVTCDFCHSIARVRQGTGRGKLGMDPRGVRYGAGPLAKNAPHRVGTSKALRDPRLCAMCHYDVDDNGITLERTYREWYEGPYAKDGVVCVGCHMAPASFADGKISHRFPGGHSDSPLLPGAAVVRVVEVTAGQVELEVHNARVGHNFPTAGAHPNALYLDVTFLDGVGVTVEEHRTRFAFVYRDADGREVEGSGKVVTIEDSTLAPRERRRIRLPLANGARSIHARILYVTLPAHMKERVSGGEYSKYYAPVEIHSIKWDL